MERFICLILSLILLLQPVIDLKAKDNGEQPINFTTSHINPLYKDVVTDEEVIEVPNQRKATGAITQYLTNKTDIAAAIRDSMVNREKSFIVSVEQKTAPNEAEVREWFELAFEETEEPREGDYLRWHYQKWSVNASGVLSGGRYYLDYMITANYYTTAEQEEELTDEVNRVLDSLGVRNSGISDYERIKKVYDYICENHLFFQENFHGLFIGTIHNRRERTALGRRFISKTKTGKQRRIRSFKSKFPNFSQI